MGLSRRTAVSAKFFFLVIGLSLLVLSSGCKVFKKKDCLGCPKWSSVAGGNGITAAR